MQTLAIGQQIDHFRVQSLIGQGAFAKVWKVTNKHSGQSLALKHIRLSRLLSDQASVLSKLSHPNIIRLQKIIKTKSDLLILLELMKSDLRKAYHRQKFTDIQIVFIVFQLCLATKYLHALKIQHQDIKPCNVLLDQHCNLKLTDFGMASQIKHDTPSQNKGTIGYNAPQKLNKTNYNNGSVDLWSIGCVFAQLYLRKPLFPCRPQEIQKQIFLLRQVFDSRDFKLHPEFAFLQNIPQEGIDLLQKLLEPDPFKRISAEQALSHSFFARLYIPKTIHSLRTQDSSRKLQRTSSVRKMFSTLLKRPKSYLLL